jgi:hypothetical protein
MGSTAEEGYRHVKGTMFLGVRRGVERLVAGESTVNVTDDLGLP